MRRFSAPWTVAAIDGGFKVGDANGQALAYVYARETKAQADMAKILTMDKARRIEISPTWQKIIKVFWIGYFVILALFLLTLLCL